MLCTLSGMLPFIRRYGKSIVKALAKAAAICIFSKAPKIFMIFSYHNLYRKDPRQKARRRAEMHKAAAIWQGVTL